MAKLYTYLNDDTLVSFECPGCECAHRVFVKPNGTNPVWTWNGSMDKPTFSPSILLQYDAWEPPVTSANLEEWHRQPWEQTKVRKVCHSFVKDGKIQFLTDSTHKFSGQTMELPDV